MQHQIAHGLKLFAMGFISYWVIARPFASLTAYSLGSLIPHDVAYAIGFWFALALCFFAPRFIADLILMFVRLVKTDDRIRHEEL